MKAPKLKTNRLYLVPLSTSHLSDDYLKWLNNPIVVKYLETNCDYTMEMLRLFLIDIEKKEILFWAIHLQSNNKHIGNIKIDPVVLKHGICEYGILMGSMSEWGKGYAKEASNVVIDYCFSILNIRKINLGVVEENHSAVALYKSLGFVIEGIYKNHGYYDGKYCNVLRMSLFNKKIY
jgi:ribosomal-protein-alanine N-acetyltransferase